MSLDWRQIPAFAMAYQQSQEMVERFLNVETIQEKEAYMADYSQKPEDMQCALGYMRCLLESSFSTSYSPYDRYSFEVFQRRRVPPMRLPLRFIGWAGPQNNIGPAYEIDPACLSGEDSRMFYTDVDIMESAEEAEWLTSRIAQESSGIEDVRAETLKCLYTLKGLDDDMIQGISFRLSETAKRKILVNCQEIECGEHGGAIFVLPKTGVFTCLLGEMVGSDPTACVILAAHDYCMK